MHFTVHFLVVNFMLNFRISTIEPAKNIIAKMISNFQMHVKVSETMEPSNYPANI